MEENFVMHLRNAIPKLRPLARKLETVAMSAQDLLQETSLRAWKARDQYEPTQPMDAWMSAILRNVAYEKSRGIANAMSKRSASIDESLARTEEAMQDGGAITALDRSIQNATTCPAGQENHIALFQAISHMNQLSPVQQQAMQVCVLEDMDYPEACEKLGLSVIQLKNRLSAARKAMREDRKVIGR